MTTITLPAGSVLRISGANGDSVRVTSQSTPAQTHTFNGTSPDSVYYGPFARDVTFTLDVLAGNPTWSTPDPLTTSLDHATDRIRSARVIATAINEGSKAMALLDKCKSLAERSRAIPQKIGDRVDAIGARYDALDAKGEKVLGGHEDFLAGVESGVAAAEDALSQLTNGGPTS